MKNSKKIAALFIVLSVSFVFSAQAFANVQQMAKSTNPRSSIQTSYAVTKLSTNTLSSNKSTAQKSGTQTQKKTITLAKPAQSAAAASARPKVSSPALNYTPINASLAQSNTSSAPSNTSYAAADHLNVQNTNNYNLASAGINASSAPVSSYILSGIKANKYFDIPENTYKVYQEQPQVQETEKVASTKTKYVPATPLCTNGNLMCALGDYMMSSNNYNKPIYAKYGMMCTTDKAICTNGANVLYTYGSR